MNLLSLFPDAIRLASVVAATLVMVTWAVTPAAPDARTRVFRRAWAMIGLALVTGLTPGLWSDYGPYGRMDSALWLVSMSAAYAALTTAAAAQSGSASKSLFGSAVVLATSFGASAVQAGVL